MREGPKQLQNLLIGAVVRRELVDHARVFKALDQWSQLAGEEFGKVSLPDRYEKGCLWVRVKSSVWVQELSLNSDRIRDSVNAAIGERLVRQLRFFVGTFDPQVVREGRAEYAVAEVDVDFQTEQLREVGRRALGRLKSASKRED